MNSAQHSPERYSRTFLLKLLEVIGQIVAWLVQLMSELEELLLQFLAGTAKDLGHTLDDIT
jgi:hypothetical protein